MPSWFEWLTRSSQVVGNLIDKLESSRLRSGCLRQFQQTLDIATSSLGSGAGGICLFVETISRSAA
jgi:hypothetical protein